MTHPLIPQIIITQAIRDFFTQAGFLDVLTPPAVQNPGMETHIHPFQLTSIQQKKLRPFFLHTSPEFCMKKLLAEGLKKIFTLTYCFRDEPKSEHHRHQFLMLEWYRCDASLFDLMDECQRMIDFCSKQLYQEKLAPTEKIVAERRSVQSVFLEYLELDILEYLDHQKLYQWIELNSSRLEITPPENPEHWAWDDLFFLLFLNCIEPKLKKYPQLYLYHYPAPLSALSQIDSDDPRVCRRFELYMNGLEIANCFQEETKLSVIRKRFEQQNKDKEALYKYNLPTPQEFYQTMEKGIPSSSGIALGVERLCMALTNSKRIFYWD